MQYLMMIYGNEAGMQAASKDQVTQMSAAYTAYTEAMTKAGVVRGGERLRPTAEATTVRVSERQEPGARRPLCRHQGAARRLLPDRRARPRCGALVGGELPRRLGRHGGSAADLADERMIPKGGNRFSAKIMRKRKRP